MAPRTITDNKKVLAHRTLTAQDSVRSLVTLEGRDLCADQVPRKFSPPEVSHQE